MNHEEHVWEPGTKVGPIGVVVPGGLGGVDVHTLGAVQLHHGLSWDVRQAWKTAPALETSLTWVRQDPAVLLDPAGPSSPGPAGSVSVVLKRLTDWEHVLVLTVDARAVTKIPLLVFLQLQMMNQKVSLSSQLTSNLTPPPLKRAAPFVRCPGW